MLEVLGKEIGLTTEQMGKLYGHRPAIRQDRETLSRCQALMRQVREDIHAHIQRSGDIMEEIRKILSPVQVAKFFVWVEKHQHSVKTLTTLWDSSRDGDGGEDEGEDVEGNGSAQQRQERQERQQRPRPRHEVAQRGGRGHTDEGGGGCEDGRYDEGEEEGEEEEVEVEEGSDGYGVTSSNQPIDYNRHSYASMVASLLALPEQAPSRSSQSGAEEEDEHEADDGEGAPVAGVQPNAASAAAAHQGASPAVRYSQPPPARPGLPSAAQPHPGQPSGASRMRHSKEDAASESAAPSAAPSATTSAATSAATSASASASASAPATSVKHEVKECPAPCAAEAPPRAPSSRSSTRSQPAAVAGAGSSGPGAGGLTSGSPSPQRSTRHSQGGSGQSSSLREVHGASA